MYPPICCFSCGKALGDKYNDYRNIILKRVAKKKSKIAIGMYYSQSNTFSDINMEDVLDAFCITKNCCRQHMLSGALLSDYLISAGPMRKEN